MKMKRALVPFKIEKWVDFPQHFTLLIRCIESFAECALASKLNEEQMRALHLVSELCIIQFLLKTQKTLKMGIQRLNQLPVCRIRCSLHLPPMESEHCELIKEMRWLSGQSEKLFVHIQKLAQIKLQILGGPAY